jgi:hypothetical protein
MAETKADRFGVPVTVDPERHDDDGKSQEVESPLGDPGPEAPGAEPEGIAGPITRFLDKLLGTAQPKLKPGVVILSGDEQAQRLVSDAALMALGAVVDKFITESPQRVVTVPSEAFSSERTVVETALPARLLIPRQPDRLRVRIRNRSANAVTLGQNVSLTDDQGFTLEDNDEIVFETRAPIYAVANGGTATVEIITEFGR